MKIINWKLEKYYSFIALLGKKYIYRKINVNVFYFFLYLLRINTYKKYLLILLYINCEIYKWKVCNEFYVLRDINISDKIIKLVYYFRFIFFYYLISNLYVKLIYVDLILRFI